MRGLMKEKDYLATYDEFWRDIVERPDGTLDPDQVKKELHDFRFMIEQVPQVYSHVTDGRISKPNTYAFEVTGQADEVAQRWADDHAADELEAALEMTPQEIRARIAELKGVAGA